MLSILITFVLLLTFGKCSSAPPTLFGSVVRDLYPNYSDDLKMEVMASSWEATGLLSDTLKVQICNGNPVLGGPGIVNKTGSFQRTYSSLPSHAMIYLDIGVKMIGNWTSSKDKFTLLIDSAQVASFSIEKVGTTDGVNSCGGSGKTDLDTRLAGSFSHTADSVTLNLTWVLASDGSTGSFAINDVSLILSSDTPGNSLFFLNLVDTSVTVTPSGNPTGKTTCQTGYYYKDASCVACNAACSDCFGADSNQCYQCAMDYNFIADGCQQCGSDCTLCSDVGDGNCLLCNYGFTLEADGTCSEDINSSHKCVSAYKYKYENASCGDSCPVPYREKWQDQIGFFCYEPCNNFAYENTSCLQTCPSPYKQQTVNGSKFCNAPCTDGLYFYRNGTCSQTCDLSEFYETTDNEILVCEEICTITKQKNGSKTTTCENPDKLCPASEFYFPQAEEEADNCSAICPYLFFTNKSAICISPCGLKRALYPDGRCLDYCIEGYTAREEGGFKFCDHIRTAIIKIHLRYDIAMASWNSGGYGAKFITMIAKLLGLSESSVQIVQTAPGSTIVDAEVVIQDGSALTLSSKATTANQKLNDAANAKALNIDGTAVLDKSFTVVMDEVKEPQQVTVTVENSSSKTVGITIGVGAGVVVLGAIIVSLRVYRFKMIQREAREREETREITYRVKDIESVPSPSQVNSPNNSRIYMQNSSSRRRLKKTSHY